MLNKLNSNCVYEVCHTNLLEPVYGTLIFVYEGLCRGDDIDSSYLIFSEIDKSTLELKTKFSANGWTAFVLGKSQP